MHIWILNHYACLRHGSGLTSHAVIAHYLQRAGHTVTVFPAAFAQVHAPTESLSPGQRFTDRFDEGVRFRFVQTRPYRGAAGRLLNMASYAHNVCRSTGDLPSPDVVIGSLSHPYAVEAACRLARRFHARFVYEIRDIWPQSLVDLGSLSRWNPICGHFRRLERRAFRRADGIISVLPGIKEYAALHGVPAHRVAYIPNGVDPGMYPEPCDPPERGPFVVGCFGRFGSGNDMAAIVEAAGLLRRDSRAEDVVIRLVGDGPSKRRLRDAAARRGLANIEFRDLVSKPELARLAAECHAFVHAHRRMDVVRRYGMSVNKVFGYMASARPTIFACQSSYDPIEVSGGGLTVPPEDPAAMADAMLRLRMTSPSERAEMGRRARRFVLEHHDLADVALRLEAFLQSLSLPSEAVPCSPRLRASA